MKEKIQRKLTTLKLIEGGESIAITEPKKLGMTNEYSFISVNGKPSFVYRIPGKQWCCGFNRETEAFNLGVVRESGVGTGVVYSSPSSGTQITTHSNPMEISSNKKELKQAILNLRKVHSSKQRMKNDYNVPKTVFDSYGRIPEPYQQGFFQDLPSLFKRIILTLMEDTDNFTSSHNEPYPSNFTKGELANDYRIVDWEYSGNNHRCWDLAFLSVTAKLTAEQDDYLLKVYFDQKKTDDRMKFYLFKTVVQFTTMLWIASGVGRCNEVIECIHERQQRVQKEHSTLTRFFNQASTFVSPGYFPSLPNEENKEELERLGPA